MEHAQTDITPDLTVEIAHINRFPLPPSVNELYATVGRRRVKSIPYKRFEDQLRIWMMTNHDQLQLAWSLSMNTGPNNFLHVDCRFHMMRGNILCKDRTPKRNDTSNRIKALHDALSQILGIDDSYFWSGTFDKVAVDDPSKVGVEITMVVSKYEDFNAAE